MRTPSQTCVICSGPWDGPLYNYPGVRHVLDLLGIESPVLVNHREAGPEVMVCQTCRTGLSALLLGYRCSLPWAA